MAEDRITSYGPSGLGFANVGMVNVLQVNVLNGRPAIPKVDPGRHHRAIQRLSGVPMLTHPVQTRSRLAHAAFALLNPIPFGFFVAALIFDAAYASNANVFWVKSAAFLNAIGLLFAVLPRLINLVHVWLPARRSTRVEKLDFWLNLLAIAAAILNAFVHSRDAYGVMPEGVWLSAVTVALIAIGFIASALQQSATQGGRRE